MLALGIKIPDKKRAETATYYMTVSRDKKDNVAFPNVQQ
jgi:hypothetical protein